MWQSVERPRALPGSGGSERATKLVGDGRPVQTGGVAVGKDNQEQVLLSSIVPVDTSAVWFTPRHSYGLGRWLYLGV